MWAKRWQLGFFSSRITWLILSLMEKTAEIGQIQLAGMNFPQPNLSQVSLSRSENKLRHFSGHVSTATKQHLQPIWASQGGGQGMLKNQQETASTAVGAPQQCSWLPFDLLYSLPVSLHAPGQLGKHMLQPGLTSVPGQWREQCRLSPPCTPTAQLGPAGPYTLTGLGKHELQSLRLPELSTDGVLQKFCLERGFFCMLYFPARIQKRFRSICQSSLFHTRL